MQRCSDGAHRVDLSTQSAQMVANGALLREPDFIGVEWDHPVGPGSRREASEQSHLVVLVVGIQRVSCEQDPRVAIRESPEYFAGPVLREVVRDQQSVQPLV